MIYMLMLLILMISFIISGLCFHFRYLYPTLIPIPGLTNFPFVCDNIDFRNVIMRGVITKRCLQRLPRREFFFFETFNAMIIGCILICKECVIAYFMWKITQTALHNTFDDPCSFLYRSVFLLSSILKHLTG